MRSVSLFLSPLHSSPVSLLPIGYSSLSSLSYLSLSSTCLSPIGFDSGSQIHYWNSFFKYQTKQLSAVLTNTVRTKSVYTLAEKDHLAEERGVKIGLYL